MEPLADYLDYMIKAAYVSVERGRGYTSLSPTPESVRNLIEHEKAGRPVPIDDSADHFLLVAFDEVRRSLSALPVPVPNGMFGKAWLRDIYREGNEMCGEIPWRSRHVESCQTCGRSTDEPSLICSAGHLDIKTRMSADAPGVVRDRGRAIPLRKADEE